MTVVVRHPTEIPDLLQYLPSEGQWSMFVEITTTTERRVGPSAVVRRVRWVERGWRDIPDTHVPGTT